MLLPAIRRNARTLGEILDADFREIGASGRIHDKASVIEALQQDPATEMTLSDFQTLQLTKDVILATYRVQRDGRTSLRSSVWRQRKGRWLLVSHQATPVADAAHG